MRVDESWEARVCMKVDESWEARACMKVDESWEARVCMRVEKREFTWELMRVEKRKFAWKLMRVEKREFAWKLMRVDESWEARVCMRVEKREFAWELRSESSHESWEARVCMRVFSTLMPRSNENKSCVRVNDSWLDITSPKLSSTLIKIWTSSKLMRVYDSWQSNTSKSCNSQKLFSSFDRGFIPEISFISASQDRNVSAMIRRRVSDGKVVVRKAAIQVCRMHAGFIAVLLKTGVYILL
jgi:hypothetical protein